MNPGDHPLNQPKSSPHPRLNSRRYYYFSPLHRSMRLLLPTKLRSFSCAAALSTSSCLGFTPSHLPLLSGIRHISCSSNQGYRGTMTPARNLYARISSSALSESTKSDGLFLFDFDGGECCCCIGLRKKCYIHTEYTT